MATRDLSARDSRLETQAASSSSQQATASSPPSLLSKLRAPTQSELVWKRKVRTNERTASHRCAKKEANLLDRLQSLIKKTPREDIQMHERTNHIHLETHGTNIT